MEIKSKDILKYLFPIIIIVQLSVVMVLMSKKTVTECRAITPHSLVCAQVK